MAELPEPRQLLPCQDAYITQTSVRMRRPMPVTPRVVPAPSPVARRVVAIVAGTRIGLNMMKSGVDTANATAEQASVTPPKPKKTTEATEAITTLITSITGKRKENILPSLCN
ncbi:hypothetical protein HID58_050322 [Brassica napus]|uniref:Uncharacterized protein n=1 Tax=Brassica napus TaxID=3708 RepID=A0ABQ8A694_BRANA|nr:hypothetical protein HID58_050322 [Brassica napus]